VTAPRRILPLIVLVAVLGVACTGGDGEQPTPAPSSTTTSPVPTGPVHFEPGHYAYEFGGVTVDLVFDGSDASMDVKNASGAELAAPSLYVVTGTGEQRDGVVTDAVAIPDGESATFQVTFPDDVDERTAGLVILSFGDSNYGALAPVPVA
jgi:hypothetical protein